MMKGHFSIQLVFCVISGSLAKPPPTYLEYSDSLGQYSFGYSAPESARSEVRSIDGTTRGSYSYVDDTGIIQTAEYIADGEHGFQVTATNLPQAPRPVEDTPEVVVARINHLKAYEAAFKLAEETSQDDGQRTVPDTGKSTDSVVIDNAVELANDKIDIQAKSVENLETLTASSLERSQNVKSDEANESVAKSARVANENPILDAGEEKQKAFQDESNEPIEPQAKSAAGSSDLPVVTTSFVIPGRVNLHTRIELDQPDVARAPIFPESSSLYVAQPSISQDPADSLNPSLLTPAGTRMIMMNEGKKAELLDGISPHSASPIKSTTSNEPHRYSSIIPGVIAPSNVYALAYGIGVDPIYHQYNPYRYFPYGIL